MAYYRLYFLSAGDRISGVAEFNCDNDQAAIEGAADYLDGRAAELWNEQRFVTRLTVDGKPYTPLPLAG